MEKDKMLRQGKKKLFGLVFGRSAVIILLLILQVVILAGVLLYFSEYIGYYYWLSIIVSVVVIIYVMNRPDNPAFTLSWIIPILVIPVFGALLYVFLHLQIGTRIIYDRHRKLIGKTRLYLQQQPEVLEALEKEDVYEAALAHYMAKCGGYPVYRNSSVKYFSCGEEKFAEMIPRLEKAKKFIFLEYFIIEEGVMLNTVLDILERKVKEGVDVRFMYDGMCSIALVPWNFPKELERRGITCRVFSPVRPALSTSQNNRDHRKVLVVDGEVAFTGGINLADEYINLKERFGYWKDVAVMVEGEAVTAFTMMFLQMWGIEKMEDELYRDFCTPQSPAAESPGYVMPYGDSPLDRETVGEQVYMDMLYHATRYVHIMTPYLILDAEMTNALTHAARSGKEVIIIMPGIPDKPYAFILAKTYYPELLRAGVKIYEYTPGFVHAKVFVSDDCRAVVGTINLDFRSLYLHFECAAYMYQVEAVRDIEADFQETLAKCHQVTVEDCRKLPVMKKIFGRCLRILAPLM